MRTMRGADGNPVPMPGANYAAATMGGNGIKFMPDTGAPIVGNMYDIQEFAVTQWDNWEFLNGSLYDSAAYPTTGVSALNFFQTPIGSGTGFGGGTKTASDTNMELNGQLSAGRMFVISTIEIEFQPSTPTVPASMPAAFGAQAVATGINDAYIFWRSGNFQLKVLSKFYAEEAPLMRYPSQSDFSLQAAAADVSSTGASMQTRIAFASAYGPAYSLSPNNLLLSSSTAFKATMSWPEGLQTITSAARVFCRLGGMLARLAQ